MDWQSKLECVLVTLLKGDITDNINENIETLLSYFHKQKEISSGLITLPLFKEWIIQSVATWDINKIIPSTNITSFTLNLASFLSKNQGDFSNLNTNNFYTKLINVLVVRQTPPAPSITAAYINLLTSLLEHKQGVEWMMVFNFWEDAVLNTKFISKFLEKVIDIDEEFCDRIVKKLTTMDDVRLIGDILVNILDGIFLEEKDFRVALVFLKHFNISGVRNDVCKIKFIMRLLDLYVKKVSGANISSVVDKTRSDFLATIAGDDFTKTTAEFCNFGVLYWNLLASQIFDTTFATELLMVLTTSNFCLLIKYCYSSYSEVDELASADNMRSTFTKKVIKSMSSDIFRICYRWRDRLTDNPENYNLFNFCTQNLIYIKESLKYVTSEQGIQVFETLTYYLIDIISAIKQFPKKFDNFVQEPQYIALFFEIIKLCIQNFHIKWATSCETIEIVAVCFDYLVLPWPPMVLLQIFQLINVAITNYMPPNLALLLDEDTNSSISLLGPLLYLKLRDNDFKMAALELISTITIISNKKFPSLQKVLLDSELPSLVVKIGTSDREEKLVQAMAIKCLGEMIQVEEIWNVVLKTQNLPGKMCNILLNKSERSMHVEAATLISVAYEHQRLPQNLDKIYETMIDASINNLYWDVRVSALNFWDKVITDHLQNQGMIDNCFPEVTFSKEHRKIVTLTDTEIRRRLLKVLSQLGSIGCLGVLMVVIKDDCDKEVAKVAVNITQRLTDLFEKYQLKSDYVPNSPQSLMSVSSGVSVMEFMDSPRSEAIDEIVNNEADRMLNYSCSDYGSVRSEDVQAQPKQVSPNEFLQFCQQDFNSFVSEKKNWLHGIEDLEVVLDTMLTKVKSG